MRATREAAAASVGWIITSIENKSEFPNRQAKEIEGDGATWYLFAVSTTAEKKKKYSKTGLEAGDRLLKAVKEKLLREKGKINYEALRRGGYSEDLISRLKVI
jgi:hypothetical protein